MGKTVTIHVTREHVIAARRLIDAGLRPPLNCPIALALNDAGYPVASVFAETWVEDMTASGIARATHLLTRRAGEYVVKFDHWVICDLPQAMPEPATFRLSL